MRVARLIGILGDPKANHRAFNRFVRRYEAGTCGTPCVLDTPAIWSSNRPAKGGETGALLAEIIERAAKLKNERAAAPPKTPRRPTQNTQKPQKKQTRRK